MNRGKKMKIIKDGDLERTKKVKRFECTNCGCVFEASKSEYKVEFEDNETYFRCKCPTCKNTVYAD